MQKEEEEEEEEEDVCFSVSSSFSSVFWLCPVARFPGGLGRRVWEQDRCVQWSRLGLRA